METNGVTASENRDDSFTYAEEVLHRLWTTKAVRFAASRRLTELDQASRLGIAVLSIYVIAATVLELLARGPTAGEGYEKLLAFVCIVAPVLILVLEAHEAGKRHLVRADRMHRSAQQIQVVHDRLERVIRRDTVSDDLLEKIDADYQAILLEFPEHQDDIDYNMIRSDYPQRFPNASVLTPAQRRRTHFARFISVWGVPCFLIVTGGALMFVAIRLLMHQR